MTAWLWPPNVVFLARWDSSSHYMKLDECNVLGWGSSFSWFVQLCLLPMGIPQEWSLYHSTNNCHWTGVNYEKKKLQKYCGNDTVSNGKFVFQSTVMYVEEWKSYQWHNWKRGFFFKKKMHYNALYFVEKESIKLFFSYLFLFQCSHCTAATCVFSSF
jgi:hypothetical protein